MRCTMTIRCQRLVQSYHRFFVSFRNFSSHKYIVPDRGFLEISGNDAKKFLQGVCTNDINKLKNHGDCIAAAFLTPKGRILADAVMYCVQNGIEKVKIVIETHKLAISPLTTYLMTYKLRSKVKITHSTDYITVLDNSDHSESNTIGALNLAGMIAVTSATDPRISSFGRRHLFSSVETTGGVAAHSADEPLIFSSAEDYKCVRLLNGLTEGPEITNRIPLECNLDLLNYIDFTKGCYVGQELTARTKFKGVVRKRVLPFLRRSLHPQQSDGNTFFCAVPEAVIKQFRSSTSHLESRAEEVLGTISILNPTDTVAGSESDIGLGDILSISSSGDICCALVRLERVLPLIPTAELPVFESRLLAVDGLPATSPDSSPNSEAPHAFMSVTPIRPPFWVDKDPVTHHRIDTHSD